MRRSTFGLLLFVVIVASGLFYLPDRKPVAPSPESPKATLATTTVPAQPAAELPPHSIAKLESDTTAELRRILKCHELLATRNAIQRTICDDIVGDANAASRCKAT
jgi:hypothetical protein